jgi:hypothetical protein
MSQRLDGSLASRVGIVLAEADVRYLARLPRKWEEPVLGSVDSLVRRGHVLVARLDEVGRSREASELRRRVVLLEQTEIVRRRASNLDVLDGLARAIDFLAGEPETDDVEEGGPWFARDDHEERASMTALFAAGRLRNRAYRLLAATAARYTKL